MKHGRLAIDWFFIAIMVAMAVGAVFPATGTGATIVGDAATAVIAVLFFLYGIRLSPAETLEGLKHWRLHVTILSATYVVFPLLAIGVSLLLRGHLPDPVVDGIMYLGLVPSTIQTSTTFTSIAHGNVAGAVVSSSASNLLGVFLTPALCWLVWSQSTAGAITPTAIVSIVAQIIVPFVVGQLVRRWAAPFVAAHPRFSLVDKGSVVLIVYAAFSTASRDGAWSLISAAGIVALVALCLGFLAVMLAITWWGAKLLGFRRADAVTIQFCGTKKSLASGLPIAGVLFATSSVALLVLPLLIFHQLQLVVCGALASHYGRVAPSLDDDARA